MQVLYRMENLQGGTKMKNDRLSVRMAPETKDQLQKLAESEGRTVTNYLEALIKREMESKGLA